MCILTDLRFPEVIGFQKEAVHHTFVVPDPAASDGSQRRSQRDPKGGLADSKPSHFA
jgi:hypothetical protein